MQKLSNWFIALSRGLVTVVATLIFILFMILILPQQAAQAEEASGGAGSPDTSFWYSADDLFQFADAYGEEGRAAYVRARWTFDLVYPLVYAFFLITTLSWLYSYATSTGSRWRQVNLFPFLGMLFDYLENTATTVVMVQYPERALLAANIAALFTLIKWFFVMGSFLLLFMGIILVIRRRVRNKQTTTRIV